MEVIENINRELKRIRKVLKELKFPDAAEIRSQFDAITKPIWTKTANSEVVQKTMDSLADFSTTYLLPAVSRIDPESAKSLEKTLKDIQKAYENAQRKQRTAPHVEKQKMKAIIYDRSSPQGMKAVEGCTVPKPGSEELLIKVSTVGLNHIDHKRQEKQIPIIASLDGKLVGTEFCGTIEELGWWKGDKVHMFPFAIGERVFGTCSGALAEYIVCPAATLAYVPKNMSNTDAAALPLCGVTAYQALKMSSMHTGLVVAVIGATGGVGNLVVQVAKIMGAAQVIGITSPEHAEAAERIGCSRVITYANDALQDSIDAKSIDICIDCFSTPDENGASYEELFKPLLRTTEKHQGTYLCLNAPTLDKARKAISDRMGYNVQRSGFEAYTGEVTAESLKIIAAWYKEGKLKPLIDHVVGFNAEEVQESVARLKSNHTLGKIVVDLSH